MTEVTELEAHIGYRLRQVSNHVSLGFARKLAVEDVTAAEWVLMRMLYDKPPTPPSRVAEAMGFTRGAITKLADRLIAKGLVVREAGANDRSRLHFTSALVTGEPSENSSPSFSRYVHVRPPSLGRPVSVAMSGTSFIATPGAVYHPVSRRCTQPNLVVGGSWLEAGSKNSVGA